MWHHFSSLLTSLSCGSHFWGWHHIVRLPCFYSNASKLQHFLRKTFFDRPVTNNPNKGKILQGEYKNEVKCFYPLLYIDLKQLFRNVLVPKKNFWNTSHHGLPRNCESKVIWCFCTCTAFIYLTSVHLQAVITQYSVLIRSQHIIICCGTILKTALDVNTFVQHLCDMLQLVTNE
jgi:hypothetical protein